MNTGKSILAKILGTAAAPSAAAVAVAAGAAELTAEQTSAGTTELEGYVERAHADGMAAGRKAERERMGAVLTNAAVEGRMGLAITMLSTTDNTAETIIACLEAAPATAAAAPATTTAVTGQQESRDPIGETTPLVSTGASDPGGQGGNDAGDRAKIDSMWDGIVANVNGTGGVAADHPFAGVFGRAN